MNVARERCLSRVVSAFAQGTLKALLTGHRTSFDNIDNGLLSRPFAHEYLFTKVDMYSL
jgi:hypothetical protein